MRFLLFLTLFVGIPLSVHAQSFTWAHGVGTWVDDSGLKVVNDESGNSFVTGHVYSGAEFGSFEALSWGFYLAKYDNTGTVIWARFGGGSYNGTGSSIAIDSDGSVYATGSFSHTLDLGDTILGGAHQTSIFLVKYSSTGQLLWAKILGVSGSNGWPYGRGLAVDSQDNVYVAGSFSGTLQLEGGVTIPEPYPHYWGYMNICLVKYNKNGAIVWGKGAAGQYYDSAPIDLVCHDDVVYLAAQIGPHTFKYDGEELDTGYTEGSSVIIGVNTEGQRVWYSFISGGISDLDIHPGGAIHACGSFYDDFSIDGDKVLNEPTGSGANFVLKYGSDKEVEWTKMIEVGGIWYPFLAAQGDDIYVAGTFNQFVKSDTIALMPIGLRDGFLLKLSDHGYSQWIKHFASGWVDDISSLTVNNHGQLTIVGHYSGQTLTIDGIELTNNSGNNDVDIFITSMNDLSENKCPVFQPTLHSNATTLCEGQSTELTLSLNSHLAHTSIKWYHDNHIVQSSGSAYSASLQGAYYYVLYPGTLCADTSNVLQISVFEKPTNNISALPSLKRCDGLPVTLTVEQMNSYQYEWFLNGNLLAENQGPVLVAFGTGTYTARIVNGPCESSTAPQSVSITQPETDFLPDTIKICVGGDVMLSPTLLNNAWTYRWSTGETSKSITVATSSDVTLTVSNDHCHYSDMTSVAVSEAQFWVSNVITPNGDGKNDAFVILNSDHNDVDLVLYNRYGIVVFEDRSYQNDWSPTNLSTGIYFYSVEDPCADTRVKGWLHLLGD
jgi:gliding motility-associated-like protein